MLKSDLTPLFMKSWNWPSNSFTRLFVQFFSAHHSDRTFAVPARSECSTAGSAATGSQHLRRKIQEGESSFSM